MIHHPSITEAVRQSASIRESGSAKESASLPHITQVVHPRMMSDLGGRRGSEEQAGSRPRAVSAVAEKETESVGTPVHSRAYETHGVRFVPAEVLFYNAFRGQCYTTTITIINISSHIVYITISQPYSSAFHIKDNGTVIRLAPGLSIGRKIIFRCSEGKLFDSVIPIRVTQSLVLLPIKVIPGQVHVVVEPTVVHFGRIDLGSAFATRTVRLHNRGSISAKFNIDLSRNELDIMITPRSGNIKPFGSVPIKVQLSGLVVGEHETEFWVKSTPPSRFIVRVTVVVPFLVAVHPFATDEFTLLDMGNCFPGTLRYETFLVRNSSSEMSTVIVLAEFDGHVVTPDIAAQDDPSFNFFRLTPSDGTLDPFESRVFTMWFAPQETHRDQGWRKAEGCKPLTQYLCFFRVQRVSVATNDDESQPVPVHHDTDKRCRLDRNDEIPSEDELGPNSLRTITESNLENKEKNNIIRVCAYSVELTPMLHIIPDELIFENVKVGQKIDKVLRIYNPCMLELGFAYVKQAHITVTPNRFEFLQPKKSMEIAVQLHPRSLQFEHTRLVFEMLCYENLTDRKNVVAIGKVSIRLDVSVKSETKALVPTFLPGITPRMHLEGEEVGLHTQIVLFSPKCKTIPVAVDWPQAKEGKPWLDSKARVAFPNERRRSLRVTAHDGNARTIFTGLPRYTVPDDPTNVYSPVELNRKGKELAKYRRFVSKQARKKRDMYKLIAGHNLDRFDEYSVDDEKLYSLLGSFPPIPPPEYKTQPDLPPPHDILCPLTPMQLFNVKVTPHVIDFGKMPPKIDCSTTIAIDNMNSFPIAVRFQSYKDSLRIPGNGFTVAGQSTAFQKITMKLETTGKHYTNMSYIINTYHSYDIKVCAEVESRSLILEPGDLTFRDHSDKDVFEMNFHAVKLFNPLGSDTVFKWKIANASPFGVAPTTGVVPARGSLTCCVYFNLKSGNQLGSVLILQVEGGQSCHFPVNFIPSNKFTLTLFSPKISCPNITFAVEFIKKIVMFNSGRRVAFFSIEDQFLPKGIKIRPSAGMVKPRSCITLSVHLTFTEIKKFSFKVPIMSMTQKSVTLTCNGYVTYPKVAFQPKGFMFRKTPIHSHTTGSFTVTNESNADIKVKFLMEPFPQFRISTSPEFVDTASILGLSNIRLAALESKPLYLQFAPHDTAGYTFLLPVVINDTLGPPVIQEPTSQFTSTYINKAEDTASAVKLPGMAVPEKLDTISIEVAVQRGYIKCSAFVFEFFKTDIKEKGGYNLAISNIYPRGSVTLRIEAPDITVDPFAILFKSGPIEPMQPIVLGEKESIELTVMFQPQMAGTYSTGIPIFVDEFSTDRPYTDIKMTGVFYRSSLTCTSSMVNFMPVEVEIEIDKVINIIANHQPEDTSLSIEIVDVDGISLTDKFTIIYPNTNAIPYGIDNFVVPVIIKFRSDTPIAVLGFLTAKDGYDGECRLTVTAIADKSTLTTHAFRFINGLSEMIHVESYASKKKASGPFSGSSNALSSCTSQTKEPFTNPDRETLAKVGDTYEFPRKAAGGALGTHCTYQSYFLTTIVIPFQQSSSTMSQLKTLNVGLQHYVEAEPDGITSTALTPSIIDEIEQYPLFPKGSSDTEYAKHMRRTKESMEDWLYEQGFQGTYRTTIGEEYFFSEQYQSALNSTNKNVHFGDVKSVLDIIIKMTGREFGTQYPLPPYVPPDRIGRVSYAIQAYKAVVTFLTRQGGHLIHVSPLYLLDYYDYVLYHEKLKPLHLEPNSGYQAVSQLDLIMAKENYSRLSTQCWLDVYLQLYKVLVFYPVMSETRMSISTTSGQPAGSVSEKAGSFNPSARKAQRTLQEISMCTMENEKGEDHLLAWMDSKFSERRPSCVPPRKVRNFRQDLEDGVVLAIITAHFCPYLDEFWSSVYWTPSNKAECQQNVVLLSIAWNAIKIGLSTSSQDLISPHPVKMLMICCLLYSVLPSYTPQDTLKFEACLADGVTMQHKLTNPSADRTIGYYVKLIDPSKSFSIPNGKNKISIPPGKSVQLDIHFFAKNVNKVSAILILCGSQVPGGYATNIVLNLKGMPAKLQHKLAVNITCPLYKMAKVNANLNSPFTQEGDFVLIISESEPKIGTASKLKPWSAMIHRKVIHSIHINEPVIKVPPVQDVPVPLTINAAAFYLKPKEQWLIFSNPKVGDFVVKVTIIPDMKAPHHIFHPPYPTGQCHNSSDTSTCNNPHCPRLVHVQIPSKNFKLWSAAKSMLSLTLNEKEKSFWNDYLETGLGLKLLSWIARQYHMGHNDMSFLFESTVTYKIESSSPLITCPPSITIENVHSDVPVDLPIHVSPSGKPALTFDVKLKTDNELRHYQVVLLKKVDDKANRSIVSGRHTVKASESAKKTGSSKKYFT